MNFGRFQRPSGGYGATQRDAINNVKPSNDPNASRSTNASTTDEGSRLASPGPSGPAPPVLTRPRAGAHISGNPGPTVAFGPSASSRLAASANAGNNDGATIGAAGNNATHSVLGRKDSMETMGMQQPTDSINLGQLKAAVASQPKPKHFTYRYDDTDTIMSELDEFFPYEDMQNVGKRQELFAQDFKGAWTESSLRKRKEYMMAQLELLESSVKANRRAAQSRLFYLLQGCFAEATGPEMQLHWVIENAKLLRSVDGVGSLIMAVRDANRRFAGTAEQASDKPNSAASSGPILHPPDPNDETNAELIDSLGMLYFVVEVFRTDDTFGDQLMAAPTPLPLFLFQMIAGLKDRLPRGYPVKKVLLLMWKTLLATLGGMKDVEKAKGLSRELAGLPPVKNEFFTKASPIDITNWRRDMSVKYTTFYSSSSTEEKLAEGIKPIPPKPNYHSTEIPSADVHRTKALPPAQQNLPLPPASGQPLHTNPLLNQNGQQNILGQPAKPKKQQFQTDPNRPFIFPFSSPSPNSFIPPSPPPSSASSSSSSSASSSSRSRFIDQEPGSSAGLVPFAIAEADKLFARHAYVSLGLYQMWETRDECMREERGLGKRGLIGFDELSLDDDLDTEGDMEGLRLQWKYEEEEMEALSRGDKEGAKKAKEKMIATKRLRRVDLIYRDTLPIMQSCVIVLLKFLLATVTGPGAAHMNSQGGAVPPGFQSPTQEAPQTEPEMPPPTKAEIDIARHREITTKAVSAILILLLKWFKASHVLKFHYLAQLLFDSNCLLLVLKMFGLADVYQTVRTKNECEDLNFFRYCYLNHSKSPPRPEDAMLNSTTSPKPSEADGDVEYITDYSWRNFFSSINFLKILQKMTKHRTHRTYMLNQYKSSQILKRMLRANQPMLQLQVLKLIKSQMPWCGRKWRQTNMKTITSIYLNCRPDLKDDWLAGTDQDTELDDALPQEYALRSLISFYNRQHYAQSHTSTGHQRSNSISAMTLDDPALNPPPGSTHPAHVRRSVSSSSNSERDVFPPRKTSAGAEEGSMGMGLGYDTYDPDEMTNYWIHEYEDVLMKVFGGSSDTQEEWLDMDNQQESTGARGFTNDNAAPGSITSQAMRIFGPQASDRDDASWLRLEEIIRSRNGGTGASVEDDAISDSESVVTVGELGEDARAMGPGTPGVGLSSEVPVDVDDVGEFATQQMEEPGSGKNTWEHMSPTTLSRLPPSPLERRRRSSAARKGVPDPAVPTTDAATLAAVTSAGRTGSEGSAGVARRRSSASSPLRPVIRPEESLERIDRRMMRDRDRERERGENDDPFNDLENVNIDDEVGILEDGEEEEDDDEDEDEAFDVRGPMPIAKTQDQRERAGAAVDEVEYAYGE